VSRIVDQGFDHAVNRTRAQNRGGESILIVIQRLTRVLILIIAIVATMALFGLNVGAALTGLGIGGLAIALAAQKTLENIIGGVSLLMDKAVSVGDSCQIGDRVGTVEDIGLRSLKLRTLDQNLLVIPNGALAQMQFENLSNRKKFLIKQKFSLRIETKVDQLSSVLDRMQSMLNQHPGIESNSASVRIESFAGAAFEVELVAYGNTADWAEFTCIRQDVLMKIAEIVDASGTGFAALTRLIYLSDDGNIRRRFTEPQAGDTTQAIGESRTGAE
jgi:MscS family membrane protein